MTGRERPIHLHPVVSQQVTRASRLLDAYATVATWCGLDQTRRAAQVCGTGCGCVALAEGAQTVMSSGDALTIGSTFSSELSHAQPCQGAQVRPVQVPDAACHAAEQLHFTSSHAGARVTCCGSGMHLLDEGADVAAAAAQRPRHDSARACKWQKCMRFADRFIPVVHPQHATCMWR